MQSYKCGGNGMEVLRFTFKTLEECIKEACKELNISEDKLEYTVIENKRGLFKSKATIEVRVEENENPNDEIEESKRENMENKNDIKELDRNNGTVRVENGKIIVNDVIGEEKKPCIIPPENLSIFVDGNEIKGSTELSENSVIKICQKEEIPQRFLNIEIDNNRMHAFVTIKYVPQYIYTLKDAQKTTVLRLEEEISEENYPPIYSEEEIIEALNSKNIVFGIIKESVNKCLDKAGVEEVLIAEGIPFVPDEEDVIDIKFKGHDLADKISDEVQKVDFKNLHSIKEVKRGDIIAVKHTGKEGQDGVNILGKEVKRPKNKKKLLKVGQGALINGDTVIAGIEGKPVYKNGIFYVFPVHEVVDDVDISTGNIDFIGEVIIHGNVKEGMEVKAHGKITIDKNVAESKLFSKSDISVEKNIISSEIIGGGEDVDILNIIDCLEKMKDNVQELLVAAEQIRNLTNNDSKDGEIIKVLIENKFKNIPKLYFKLLRYKNVGNEEKNEVLEVIKNKLIGLGPIEIKGISELYKIIEIIEDKLKSLNKEVTLPVNVSIGYSQDSVIKSSGSIYINGKGEYVSEILAKREVIFTNDNAVARGGIIEANNKIECAEVGSEGGVITKLQVGKKGHIYAKKAYQNTVFLVGSREYVLDTYSRDIHVYLDSEGEIVIEKLNA